jgi:Cu2+-exporting ATPase
MKHTYNISGMTCNGCKNHVEQVLQKVDGVKSVSVNLEKSEAEVTMETHVPLEKMKKALEDDSNRYSISVPGQQHYHPTKGSQPDDQGKGS